MSTRTHAGVLCQQSHLSHRTLADARRCDAETAEAAALQHYLDLHRHFQSGESTRRGAIGPRLLTLAVATFRRLFPSPDA